MFFRNFKSASFYFMVGLIAIISCDKDDDETLQNQIQDNITLGTWRVTEFIDSGFDATSIFTGFNFTFDDSGSVTASFSAITFTGTWNISDSNTDQDVLSDLDFNIHFPLTNEFEDLNQDWDIISQSSTKIELMHVGGGATGTDFLTLEKN